MSAASIAVRPGARHRTTRGWLKAATQWRVLSLFFQLPTRATRRELKGLLPKVPRNLAALAQEWLALSFSDAETEYHRVLGAGGVPAVESSYDPNALAGRGPLLADVRGFYEAFAYRPEKPPAELPDHIAVELDFLSYLAFKIAFARHQRSGAEIGITTEAYEHFLAQHLNTWLAPFHERLTGTQSPVYARISATLLDAAGASLGTGSAPN